MYWLPGYLYWGDCKDLKTRLTENKWATKEQWYQESHLWTLSTINKTQNWLGFCWMCHLQHKLPTMTVIRKLVHKLRTKTSEPMSKQLPAPYKQLTHATSNRHTSTNYNFHVLATNHITTKLTNPNRNQRHKYHNLMTTLHLTLKMSTNCSGVETSVTNNSLSKGYPYLDDHTKQITDTPGFKPFTK